MQDQLKKLIATVANELYGLNPEVEIDRPEEQFGDYSTNVAMKLTKEAQKAPKEIAEELVARLDTNSLFSEVSVAGPGFINLKLANKALIDQAFSEPSKSLVGQVVVAEYSDPNPFKILHAGHLYTSIIGDSIANLLEAAGASVHRVNFGGDVGLHVGISFWAILKDLGGELPEKLDSIAPNERSAWLAKCYVEGTRFYESDELAKSEIRVLNKRIYEIALNHDQSSPLAKIYWTTRQWSYDYFESFYARLNIKFEKYYPESEVAGLGIETVKAHIPKVYQESQGAVIFKGEDHGLYSNVFINSEGLPTYGAKDIGLVIKKWQDYHFNKSVIITANEQQGHMKVVLKSLEQFEPKLAESTIHLTHGVVKLAGGVKMSSRLGNVLIATDILDLAEQATRDKAVSSYPKITIGAVKYAFVKQGIGGDIVYNPSESVSIEGNSGPYLQYAYARAKSILSKADGNGFDLKLTDDLTDQERSLIKKIGEYSEVVELATAEFRPHLIAGYLFDLAQHFNRFYENNRVIGDERQSLRLSLIKLYTERLDAGLKLLGIETVNKM